MHPVNIASNVRKALIICRAIDDHFGWTEAHGEAFTEAFKIHPRRDWTVVRDEGMVLEFVSKFFPEHRMEDALGQNVMNMNFDIDVGKVYDKAKETGEPEECPSLVTMSPEGAVVSRVKFTAYPVKVDGQLFYLNAYLVV